MVWNADKPDGQAMKVLDVTRMRARSTAGRRRRLREGLAKTIAWYRANKAQADAKW